MPLGSKYEAHSFSIDERIATMDARAASGLPTERMLIGAGALALPDTIRLARHAISIGVGGVCVKPPFYYKPAEDIGLFDFFSRVIDGVGDDRLRLCVYDWESNLSVHHSLTFFHRLFETYRKLAVGIKDSSGDPNMLEERCKALPLKESFYRNGRDHAHTFTGLRQQHHVRCKQYHFGYHNGDIRKL